MKIKKILLIVLFITILLTGCGKTEETSVNEPLSIPHSISFSQLKEIAIEPTYVQQKNYIISGELFNIDSNSTYVQCLGSNLTTVYENSKYALKNFKTEQVICSDIRKNAILDYYGYFQVYNYVYANSSLPIAIYGTYNSSSSKFTINYVDPYGEILKTESLYSNKCLYRFSTKTVGDYIYFVIQQADGYSENVYFRYKCEDKKYSVELITEYEYSNAASENEPIGYEYTDDLVECYDSKGQVFAYYYSSTYSYFLYDANKHYLNNIHLSSFGFNSNVITLRLEKKICLFKNDSYYESEMTKGSNPTYKCRCLEIDLSTGQVSYIENFKYYVVYATSKTVNKVFDYCYFTYYDVKDNGELSKTEKCVILKDKLAFENAFIYDGFTSNVYIVDDNTLLANFDTGLYLVTQNERTRINGISSISYFENGNIIYRNKDSKYYTCKLSDILESIKKFEGGVTYLSTNTYNGKTISYDYDSKTGKYIANGLELNQNFVSYAELGIYITDKCVYVGDNKIIDGGELSISQVTNYITFGDSVIYRVRFSDSTYIYFKYNSVLED